MFLFCAIILYLIAAILGFWSASLLWRAWHSWRLQRRGRRGVEKSIRIVSAGRRRFGVGVALIALPFAGVAYSIGQVVRSGEIASKPEPLVIAVRAVCAVMVFLALSALYVAVRFDPSSGRRRCGKCWYDMSATEGRLCPECGFTPPSEKGMFRTRRAPRLALLALVFLVGAYVVHATPRVNQYGMQAAVPTTALILGFEWWPDQYVNGPQYALDMRARYGELWGWQRALLRWKVSEIVRSSDDLHTIGRAGVFTSEIYEDSVSHARMGPAGQLAFFTAFGAGAAANTGVLPPAVLNSMHLLPEELAPEAIGVAVPAINAALASSNPMIVNFGVWTARSLGRDAEALTPALINIARQGTTAQTQLIALSTLAHIGEWHDEAWQAYLEGFDSANPALRNEVVRFAQYAARYDEAIHAKLIAALDDRWDETSGMAAQALLKARGCEVVPSLARLLHERPLVGRHFIVDLATKCPQPEVVECVRAMLEGEDGAGETAAISAAMRLDVHAEPLLPVLRRLRDGGADTSNGGLIISTIHEIEAALEVARERR